MVFLSGNKLKLLREGATFRQRLRRLFSQTPKDVKEGAELILTRSDFEMLMDQVNWHSLGNNELVRHFLECVLKSTLREDEVLATFIYHVGLHSISSLRFGEEMSFSGVCECGKPDQETRNLFPGDFKWPVQGDKGSSMFPE
jgi:hypothetical protein